MEVGWWCRIHRMGLTRWCHAGQASSSVRLTLAWPGTTYPHPVKCTGQTGSTVRSHLNSPSVNLRVCRAVAAEGQCHRPVGCVVVAQGAHRVASPSTALLVASRLWSDALAGCALASWLRSGAVRLGRGGCAVGAALTRCGGAVVTPFTSGAWPVQVGSPQFFLGQGRGWAVSRAYTYQTPHNCVGHNP